MNSARNFRALSIMRGWIRNAALFTTAMISKTASNAEFEAIAEFGTGPGLVTNPTARTCQGAEPGQNTLMDEANYISTPTGSLYVNQDDEYSEVPNGCVNGFAYSVCCDNKKKSFHFGLPVH
jgi:hypothetical protein